MITEFRWLLVAQQVTAIQWSFCAVFTPLSESPLIVKLDVVEPAQNDPFFFPPPTLA